VTSNGRSSLWSVSQCILTDEDITDDAQDLRNHGHSFHHKEHNYSVMAEDVEKFIHQHDLAKCVLIGHSMYVSLLNCHRGRTILNFRKGEQKLQ
jgi:pimeloyl-ACP methyl ester carboxylesterase